MDYTSETILINTDVPLFDIYDATLSSISKTRLASVNSCNINNSLLMNSLYLSSKKMIKTPIMGGKKRSKKSIFNKTKNKKRNKKAANYIKKSRKNRKVSIHRCLSGGLSIGFIQSLVLTLITLFYLNPLPVAGVQPESDDDVVSRLYGVDDIKAIFKNKYGTCGINTALFLGSIDLDTYEKVSMDIITKGEGVSYSNLSKYLNSSLVTLWGWEHIYITDIAEEQLYLRGAVENQRYSIVTNYINILKEVLTKIKSENIHSDDQGILTALGYPSGSVLHAVVAWLDSDGTFTIIDPQKFVTFGTIVLYSDNPSKYSTFKNYDIRDYFMDNLAIEHLNSKPTTILKNLHVKRTENLEELTGSKEKVQSVIDNLRLLELKQNADL
jgi:hypothetical protein